MLSFIYMTLSFFFFNGVSNLIVIVPLWKCHIISESGVRPAGAVDLGPSGASSKRKALVTGEGGADGVDHVWAKSALCNVSFMAQVPLPLAANLQPKRSRSRIPRAASRVANMQQSMHLVFVFNNNLSCFSRAPSRHSSPFWASLAHLTGLLWCCCCCHGHQVLQYAPACARRKKRCVYSTDTIAPRIAVTSCDWSSVSTS